MDTVFAKPALIRREGESLKRLAKLEGLPTVAELLESSFVARTGRADLGAGLFPMISHFGQLGRRHEVFPARTESYPAARILSEQVPGVIARRGGSSLSIHAVDALLLEDGDYLHSMFEQISITYRIESSHPSMIRALSVSSFEGIYARGGRRLWGEGEVSVENLAIISDHFPGGNYAHWLLDWVPRLRVIRDMEPDFSKLTIALPRTPKRFESEILIRLGFEPGRIFSPGDITNFAASSVRARRVFSSSLTSGRLFHSFHGGAQWAADFVRRIFPIPSGAAKRRIIVRRKRDRNLVFHEVDQRRLEALGYESVFLENLSVKEQTLLFSACSAVIAPHGAGLANIVFCQPGTAILEICSEFRVTSAYFLASHACSLRHFVAMGKSQGALVAGPRRDPDIEVPSQVVESFLDQA